MIYVSDDTNALFATGDGPKRGYWESVKPQVFRSWPYVHIDQFLEEVERRSKELAAEGLPYDREFVDVVFQLAEKVRRGKRNS